MSREDGHSGDRNKRSNDEYRTRYPSYSIATFGAERVLIHFVVVDLLPLCHAVEEFQRRGVRSLERCYFLGVENRSRTLRRDRDDDVLRLRLKVEVGVQPQVPWRLLIDRLVPELRFRLVCHALSRLDEPDPRFCH